MPVHKFDDVMLDSIDFFAMCYCVQTTMGFDTARFVDEVDAELICSICHGVLEDPRQVNVLKF